MNYKSGRNIIKHVLRGRDFIPHFFRTSRSSVAGIRDNNKNILTWFNVLQKSAGFILDLIFPIECFGCNQEGAWLCQDCFRGIKIKENQYCLRCKKENNFGEFCRNCKEYYFLDGVWIAGNYNDKLLAVLVKGLKYRFVKGLSEFLGRFLSLFLRDIINRYRLNDFDLKSGEIWRKLDKIKNSKLIFLGFKEALVISVPLHKKRIKWRGFNQAESIAEELVKYFNLEIDFENLIRIKYKKAQAKLKEGERKINIKGCFLWQGEDLGGRNVILVDDVVTTGSTLNECAKVLKENGAGEVWGLVVAKG